jgi:hypothetical protein
MTNSNSSNSDIGFTIPKEIRDYYEIEFVCVIDEQKQFVVILRSHIQFFNVGLAEFKINILKPILDELEEAKRLSSAEKKWLIEFKCKLEGF